MIHSFRLLTLGCISISILASSTTLAETPEHACGNVEVQSGTDFRTFRALANPAINAPAAPVAKVKSDSGVQHASHVAAEIPQRKSPKATRIPSTIVVDPNVATIRLVGSSVEPAQVSDAPALMPVPTEAVEVRLAPEQPKDLLSRLTYQSQQAKRQDPAKTAPAIQSPPICDSSNAPKNAPQAEPFATLSEADSSKIPKHWNVSTRKPKTIDQHGNETAVLSPVDARPFAPTPMALDMSTADGRIDLTSAMEEISDIEPDGDEVPFWVQPSFLGEMDTAMAVVTPSKFVAPEKIATQPISAPSELTEITELAEFAEPTEVTGLTELTEITEPKSLDAAVLNVEQPASVKKQSEKQNWASMATPGREEDNVQPEVKPKPEMKPRQWAGLFVQEVEHDQSKSYTTQVAFDQPLTSSTVPTDRLLAQNDARRSVPLKGGRRRMRLNFLDDPGESSGDPTRDALKSLLDSEEDDDEEPSSLLDDLEDETSDYKQRYQYAWDDVIEPKPLKKVPRNYAPTLKDIFGDEEEGSDPAIERLFCDWMWTCAGGKCMTPQERMQRNYRRNYALFRSPCGTTVCRPMDGFEERVRNMSLPTQPVPATTPQLSPAPASMPGLPNAQGPVLPLPNASAAISAGVFK